MRYLAFVLLISVALVAESDSASVAEPIGLFPSSELVEQETTESTGHLVVLGALKKVNHELRPKKSILVPGRKDASTWYLPEARSTKQVADHIKSELLESANLLFECRGRSCGSSSYWANKYFERAILYGPEQYQYYLIAQRSVPQHSLSQQKEEGDYIVIYIGERATRKIYVHIEYISRIKP
jgi:hypothetical protein